MAKELESEACKVGLKINPKKTVTVIIVSNDKILIENSAIYVCREIAFEKNLDCELSRRRT